MPFRLVTQGSALEINPPSGGLSWRPPDLVLSNPSGFSSAVDLPDEKSRPVAALSFGVPTGILGDTLDFPVIQLLSAPRYTAGGAT